MKHQGKRHEIELDTTSTGETFKYQLYSLTGVEPDRQKILVKGGQLKDETELSTLNAKAGQTFMMMGTPAEGDGAAVVERPKDTVKFLEDMTEAEAAKSEGAIPAGLDNLGNTCYLNSTLQALRSVPELQQELAHYSQRAVGGGVAESSQFGMETMTTRTDLTACLRDLYKQMSETQESFPPIIFLQALRQAFPQFAEKSKSGPGYAQQDAEEAWSQIVSQLGQKLKIKEVSSRSNEPASEQSKEISFIEKYLAGRFEYSVECDEASAKEMGEEVNKGEDVFFKLDCHINKDINHLRDGILAALEEKIEKKSAVLDREAVYTKTSRIARLPKYLTVHFVRFFWKREAKKKAKIMRKVTFSSELDVVEFCTEKLQKQLAPVRDKVREIRKDEEEVTRARKKQKMAHKQNQDREHDVEAGQAAPSASGAKAEKAEKAKAEGKKADGTAPADADTEMKEVVYKTDAEYDAERTASIRAAKKELFGLIDPELATDEGANKSGIYELRGVVTHQGASADSGHYTAYVKKQGALDGQTGKRKAEDGKWWWFNDHRVSEVEADKIETLSGGGMFLFLFFFRVPPPSFFPPFLAFFLSSLFLFLPTLSAILELTLGELRGLGRRESRRADFTVSGD